MYRRLTLALIFAFGLLSTGFAQIKTPAPSPFCEIEQAVGLSTVKVEYSRPGAKERTIFAKDGLVPYGQIWRTGANAATKITFEEEVMLADKSLPAGSYAILSKPGASEWEVHFFPYESSSWPSYLEKDPKAIVKVKSTKLNDMHETFTIGFEHLDLEGAHLTFTWEKTQVAIPLKMKVKEKVMANIEQVLAGPSANDYYSAASFLHASGGDLNTALEYIQKATAGDDARFWHLRREALILADLGKKKDAIAAAKKSMALAKEAGNDDYVRLNEASIKEWSK